MTLIAPDNSAALAAVLLGLAWLGFYADGHPTLRKLSGVPWVIGVALLLSNTGVIPLHAPAYDFVGRYVLPLGIPLLLLKADLRAVFRASGWVLPAFFIASFGVSLGAVVGFHVFDLGPEGAKVAGTYAAGFIGGVSDFVAVSQAVGMSPTQFSVALSASSPASILGLLALVSLPAIPFIRRHIPSKIIDASSPEEAGQGEAQLPRFRLTHVAFSLALSFAIVAVADIVSARFDLATYHLLVVTVITVLIANLLPRQLARLEGEFALGMLCMYVFFAMIGAGTDGVAFIAAAPILFVYCTSMLAIHFVVVLLAAKLLRIDLAEALIGSAAAIVGAAAAAAVATAKGWRSLVTPAITIGMFAKLIANFIGIAIVRWLS